MNRRLVHRNANACFALALGCTPFILIFLLVSWHERNFSIWTVLPLVLPLGLMVLGKHFLQTETPREVWWFSSTEKTVSADLTMQNFNAFLNQLPTLVESGFGEAEISQCLAVAQDAFRIGETQCEYSVVFRDKKIMAKFEFEVWEENQEFVSLFLWSNMDFIDAASELLEQYEYSYQ